MAGAVQFFGVDSVVEAYEDRGIDAWAVFDRKYMLQSGDCADKLRGYLGKLAQHGSAAIYMLQFYRDTEPDDIRPKTECDSSFAFKLTESGSAAGMGMVRMAGGGDIVMQKLHGIVSAEVGKVLEDKLSGKSAGKKANLVDELIDLLHDPDRLVTIIAGVKQIFSPGMPAGISGVMPPAAAVRRAGPKQPDMPDETLLEQLEETLNILERHDPKLVVHLTKLAALAQSEPLLFKGIIAKLDIL